MVDCLCRSCSVHGADVSAVDAIVRAVEVVGAWACQECDEVGDFGWVSEAAYRYVEHVTQNVCFDLGPVLAPPVAHGLLPVERFDAVGDDDAWTDRVDRDAGAVMLLILLGWLADNLLRPPVRPPAGVAEGRSDADSGSRHQLADTEAGPDEGATHGRTRVYVGYRYWQ